MERNNKKSKQGDEIREDVDLNIISIKDIEDKINKDIEDGRKVIDKKIGVKIGTIEKCSFEPTPHMIVDIKIVNNIKEKKDEKIWLEGPSESFEKGDYSEGKRVEIIAKNIGTIVGECDFGKIDNPLPLYVADYVRIMEFGIKEIKIGIIKKSSFDEDGIHAIVIIGNEEIFVEGSVGTFETGDYAEGTWVEITGKDFGTIVGEWEFGDLGILPLFNIESMKILRRSSASDERCRQK